MSKHNLCGGLCWVTRANSLCVSVFLPFILLMKEKEKKDFPLESQETGDALNAESPEGKLRNLPTQGKFLVSLNPSNCSPGQVLAAKSATVTQQMNKFKLAFSGPHRCWSQREREPVFIWGCSKASGAKFWQNRKPSSILKQKPWVSAREFCFRGLTYMLWDLGQVLFLLWALISRSEKSRGQNTWHLGSLLVLTSSVEESWTKALNQFLRYHIEKAFRDNYSEHFCSDGWPTSIYRGPVFHQAFFYGTQSRLC